MARDGLADFLGEEGHERVEQPQRLFEHLADGLLRPGFLLRLFRAVEIGLGPFDVPVAELVPEEMINRLRGLAELVGFDQPYGFRGRLASGS